MPVAMIVNKKKRGAKARKVAVKKRKPSSGARRKSGSRAKSKTTKYKRNPSPRGMLTRALERQVKPAALQAAGALGIDVIFGYLSQYIPASLSTGMVRHLTKGVGAVAISAIAAQFAGMKAGIANELAKGSLTITMHDAGKELLGQVMPTLPLNGLGYFSPAHVVPRLGQYVNTSAGSRVALPGPSRLQGTPRSRRLGVYVSTRPMMQQEQPFDSSVID